MPTNTTTNQPESSAAIMAEVDASGVRADFFLILGLREYEATTEAALNGLEIECLSYAGRTVAEGRAWSSVLAALSADVGSALRNSDFRPFQGMLLAGFIKSRPKYAAAVARAGAFVEAYESALAREAREREDERAAIETRLRELDEQIAVEQAKFREASPVDELAAEREQLQNRLSAAPAVSA